MFPLVFAFTSESYFCFQRSWSVLYHQREVTERMMISCCCCCCCCWPDCRWSVELCTARRTDDSTSPRVCSERLLIWTVPEHRGNTKVGISQTFPLSAVILPCEGELKIQTVRAFVQTLFTTLELTRPDRPDISVTSAACLHAQPHGAKPHFNTTLKTDKSGRGSAPKSPKYCWTSCWWYWR